MKPGEIKTEPKTEPFDESDKAAQQQQSTSQTASNTTFIDTISNSEGNEILVLVPASSNNANGLTNTEYTKDTNDITRNLERKPNDSHSNNSNRNIVTEQILWIPKIEAQTREDFGQQQQQQQQQVTAGNVACQPPPLYSRIMQLNYPQVDNVFRHQNFFSLLFQNFSMFKFGFL